MGGGGSLSLSIQKFLCVTHTTHSVCVCVSVCLFLSNIYIYTLGCVHVHMCVFMCVIRDDVCMYMAEVCICRGDM